MAKDHADLEAQFAALMGDGVPSLLSVPPRRRGGATQGVAAQPCFDPNIDDLLGGGAEGAEGGEPDDSLSDADILRMLGEDSGPPPSKRGPGGAALPAAAAAVTGWAADSAGVDDLFSEEDEDVLGDDDDDGDDHLFMQLGMAKPSSSTVSAPSQRGAPVVAARPGPALSARATVAATAAPRVLQAAAPIKPRTGTSASSSAVGLALDAEDALLEDDDDDDAAFLAQLGNGRGTKPLGGAAPAPGAVQLPLRPSAQTSPAAAIAAGTASALNRSSAAATAAGTASALNRSSAAATAAGTAVANPMRGMRGSAASSALAPAAAAAGVGARPVPAMAAGLRSPPLDSRAAVGAGAADAELLASLGKAPRPPPAGSGHRPSPPPTAPVTPEAAAAIAKYTQLSAGARAKGQAARAAGAVPEATRWAEELRGLSDEIAQLKAGVPLPAVEAGMAARRAAALRSRAFREAHDTLAAYHREKLDESTAIAAKGKAKDLPRVDVERLNKEYLGVIAEKHRVEQLLLKLDAYAKHPLAPPAPLVQWTTVTETVEDANEDVPPDTLELSFTAVGGLRDGSGAAAAPLPYASALPPIINEGLALQEAAAAAAAASKAARTQKRPPFATGAAPAPVSPSPCSPQGSISLSFALPLPVDSPASGSTGAIQLLPQVASLVAMARIDDHEPGPIGTPASYPPAAASAASQLAVYCPLLFRVRYMLPKGSARATLRAAERRPLLLELSHTVIVTSGLFGRTKTSTACVFARGALSLGRLLSEASVSVVVPLFPPPQLPPPAALLASVNTGGIVAPATSQPEYDFGSIPAVLVAGRPELAPSSVSVITAASSTSHGGSGPVDGSGRAPTLDRTGRRSPASVDGMLVAASSAAMLVGGAPAATAVPRKVSAARAHPEAPPTPSEGPCGWVRVGIRLHVPLRDQPLKIVERRSPIIEHWPALQKSQAAPVPAPPPMATILPPPAPRCAPAVSGSAAVTPAALPPAPATTAAVLSAATVTVTSHTPGPPAPAQPQLQTIPAALADGAALTAEAVLASIAALAPLPPSFSDAHPAPETGASDPQEWRILTIVGDPALYISLEALQAEISRCCEGALTAPAPGSPPLTQPLFGLCAEADIPSRIASLRARVEAIQDCAGDGSLGMAEFAALMKASVTRDTGLVKGLRGMGGVLGGEGAAKAAAAFVLSRAKATHADLVAFERGMAESAEEA